MQNWFLLYMYLSGGIMVLLSYHELWHSERGDKIKDDISDIALYTGSDPRLITALLFLIVALFGWVMLPLKVAGKILTFFMGE